jgi:hypothetical protein
MCDETCTLVRERLGEAVYGDGDDELHDVVARLLAARNLSVALVEGATTGGQISMWMSENSTVASGVKSAFVIPDRWDSEALRAHTLVGATVVDSLPVDWLQVATAVSAEVRLLCMRISCYAPRPFTMNRSIQELSYGGAVSL